MLADVDSMLSMGMHAAACPLGCAAVEIGPNAVELQAVVSKEPKDGSSKVHEIEQELAEAYWRLGQAYATEANHPDQDNFTAAKVLLEPLSPCYMCSPCMHLQNHVVLQA